MRTSIALIAALLQTAAYAASSTPADAPVAADAKPAPAASKPATNADEDEDEPPNKAKKDEPAPAAAAQQAPLGAVNESGASSAGDQQKLVSGAPLYNPNVAVHIVEKKEYEDRWKREVVVYPLAWQMNGKFTQHTGLGGSLVWHLQENFGLMAMGLWNWQANESDFNAELIQKVRAEAQAATSLLLVGGALGGVEVTPLYGKFVFYDTYLVHFSIVLSAGAGIGFTKHQLKPSNDAGPATFGDTGSRFLAEIGGGFRVQFAKWFVLRLELRDLVYTARVDSVNGCNSGDLKAMDTALRAGDKDLKTPVVAAQCNITRFREGQDYNGDGVIDHRNSDDVPLAYALVKTPSSDVLNNLGIYLGAAFTF